MYDTVEDEHGKPKRVLNGKQTTLAQQKQQLVRDAFKDWIWADPTRRQTLVEQYNREMNSIRPREYDGSHIVFAGMNPEIRLREHQRNAIAHVLYGGNTLLAHEVGAGKTFEMVGAAMEAKRLGLCRKSLFVVPNHLTEQWASEFLRLYPSANILVTKQKDFETQNRKKFCARIATGDYDAVIIGHSQFEKIPISQERQEALLKKQIEEISTGIWELKANRAERFTVKQMERAKRSLEGRLEKLQAEHKKDDVVTFAEQESFRDWLKGQPPEEILNHAYEYTIREDILLSLEYHDLSDAQINALMNSPSPLADVFKDFEKLETDHMDTVWDCLENRADAILEEQRRVLREMPVYTQSGTYAHEHGELEQYRASNEANMACKQAVEDAIRDHYSGYSLDGKAAVAEVVNAFGIERTMYILANTVPEFHRR